jgi:hypothetical protein
LRRAAAQGLTSIRETALFGGGNDATKKHFALLCKMLFWYNYARDGTGVFSIQRGGNV